MSPAEDETGIAALVAWLEAQVDEDEAAARVAGGEAWVADTDVGDHHNYGIVVVQGSHRRIAACGIEDLDDGEHRARHIARWDPAAVLAVVKAMREMLDEHCGYYGERPDTWFPVRVITRLAQAYRGRPGWREEWDGLISS